MLGKTLGAIPALQEERLAAGGLAESLFEFARFPAKTSGG